ncbi:MAG TPA: hypothetical protein VFB45_23880 [Pseudolabrys sp.]|nr:hypothetical protein [Pseudolabrys sp.]
MRHYYSLCAAAFFALATPAAAATSEDAYIAARDRAIKEINAAADAKPQPAMDKLDAMSNKARADLEQRLRGIVGPVAIKGVDGQGALNLDTLIKGDESFGILDGIVYGPLDGKTRVIVTTRTLLTRWLREHKTWWGDKAPMLQVPAQAVREEAFYTQAVLTDSAILRFAELPLRKPADADFAFAMLAARTQDQAPDKADEIFVALGRGARVYVASSKEVDPLGPIAACQTIRADLSRKASEAAARKDLSDTQRSELSDKLSAQADRDYLSCFAREAPQQKDFTAAVAAAQALMERLPPR